MSTSPLQLPFVWPDSRQLEGVLGPVPDVDSLLTESQIILGVVHGITQAGVQRLHKILTTEPAVTPKKNGKPSPPPIEKKVRLIVTVYPTCPTTSNVLLALSHLQATHPALEVRLVTCGLLAGPENTLLCYQASDLSPTLLFGSSASLEELSKELTHLTVAFTPEPILAAEWANGFNVRWLRGSRSPPRLR